MSFLLPAFLLGGGLVALPLILHFLRKKPTRTVPFPSLRFLGPTILRESRKHRIRRWIVLALRCLAILLLALAFSRPFFAPPIDTTGSAVVVAVDNSFSMQTGDRWESLRKWALDQTFGLGPGDQLGILLMHPTPTWLVPLSDDIGAGHAALRELEPGFFATRYQPALRLAGEVLAAAPQSTRTLVWMADEQRLGWRKSDFETPLPAGVELVAAVARTAPERQAAVSDLQVTATGQKLVAEVKVTGFAPSVSERTLALRVDGQTLDTKKVSLRSGETESVRFSPVEGADDEHRFEVVLDADDLAADDVAYASWQPNAGLPVILPEIEVAREEADFLAHAIAAARPERGETLRGVSWNADDWEPGSVLVLRGEEVFRDPKLDDFLGGGGQAWLFFDGGTSQREWLKRHGVAAPERLAAEGDRRLGNIDVEHPAMRPFEGRSLVTLLNLRFDRAWGFDDAQVIPIARWADGSVALGEVRVGEGTVLVSGFDLSRTDGSLVIETAFVPLVHQALTWLHRANRTHSAVRVGDTVEFPGAPGELTRNDEAARAVEGAWLADRPGVYRFARGEESRVFAVNLTTEESDLAPWPSPNDLESLQSNAPVTRRAVQRASMALSSEKTEQQRQVWWWLLGFAAIVLMVEMSLANRTAM